METALPRRGTKVVVQNAWNVIERAEFDRLSAPYPPQMRRRMQARRLIAQANLAVSSEAWCLTESFAQLVRAGSRATAVRTSPIDTPLDICGTSRTYGWGGVERWAVVPGTVTWYKRPGWALRWLADDSSGGKISHVLFAGADDGSGCWDHVRELGGQLGIAVARRSFSRSDLLGALERCAVTVLPSGLESLGFALSEALHLSPCVVASPIDAHREVANRIGRAPLWMGESANRPPPSTALRVQDVSIAGILGEWVALGRGLGLQRRNNSDGSE